MRSPKQTGDRERSWYRYYAGYSPDFVEDAIEIVRPDQDGLVLDPWNGSGTTTWVCDRKSIPSLGLDLNPVLVVVGRSRLVGPDLADSIAPLAADLIEHARRMEDTTDSGDPLLDWLDEGSVRPVRRLCAAIRRVLSDGPNSADLDPLRGDLPPLAAFFYVSLFLTIRSILTGYRTSNPTWIRWPGEERVTFPEEAFFRSFLERCTDLREKLKPQTRGHGSATVKLANSTQVPLADGGATAVITSPPYCTRIDYVVATRPELAVLGVTRELARDLRDSMTGTPTMTGRAKLADPAWGREANQLLDRIVNHPSRASSTYYLTYYLQYFDSMWRSFRELARVLRQGSSAILVVQDSYYKEVHVDLPSIMIEMAQLMGFSKRSRTDFHTSTMAAVNPRSKTWRSTFGATESVLHLVREA